MSSYPQAMQAQSISLPRNPATAWKPLASFVGFFFSFRLVFVLMAVRFFGQDATVGVVASLLMNYFLFFLALFTHSGASSRPARDIFRNPCMRPVLLFLALSGISLLWSVSACLPAAAAFWCAMAADTAIVVLLLRGHELEPTVNSLFGGYIWAACVIAAIAWMLPSQSDLRLGDEDLLGPNQVGWVCAFALFLAQYLVRKKNGRWILPKALLFITVLRTLSKTTIVAFLAGQAYILLRDRTVTRRNKLLIAIVALMTVAIFSGLIANYYDVYTNAGNQAETLTGRLGIWAYILNEAMEMPWLGHGFHSVWKVIPPFGAFEARHAHNELLQQFYAYGILGIATLFVVYGSVFRQLRKTPDASLRVLFQGMLLFVIIRGFADTEVFDLSLPVWFIAIIGALIAQAVRENGAIA